MSATAGPSTWTCTSKKYLFPPSAGPAALLETLVEPQPVQSITANLRSLKARLNLSLNTTTSAPAALSERIHSFFMSKAPSQSTTSNTSTPRARAANSAMTNDSATSDLSKMLSNHTRWSALSMFKSFGRISSSTRSDNRLPVDVRAPVLLANLGSNKPHFFINTSKLADLSGRRAVRQLGASSVSRSISATSRRTAASQSICPVAGLRNLSFRKPRSFERDGARPSGGSLGWDHDTLRNWRKKKSVENAGRKYIWESCWKTAISAGGYMPAGPQNCSFHRKSRKFQVLKIRSQNNFEKEVLTIATATLPIGEQHLLQPSGLRHCRSHRIGTENRLDILISQRDHCQTLLLACTSTAASKDRRPRRKNRLSATQECLPRSQSAHDALQLFCIVHQRESAAFAAPGSLVYCRRQRHLTPAQTLREEPDRLVRQSRGLHHRGISPTPHNMLRSWPLYHYQKRSLEVKLLQACFRKSPLGVTPTLQRSILLFFQFPVSEMHSKLRKQLREPSGRHHTLTICCYPPPRQYDNLGHLVCFVSTKSSPFGNMRTQQPSATAAFLSYSRRGVFLSGLALESAAAQPERQPRRQSKFQICSKPLMETMWQSTTGLEDIDFRLAYGGILQADQRSTLAFMLPRFYFLFLNVILHDIPQSRNAKRTFTSAIGRLGRGAGCWSRSLLFFIRNGGRASLCSINRLLPYCPILRWLGLLHSLSISLFKLVELFRILRYLFVYLSQAFDTRLVHLAGSVSLSDILLILFFTLRLLEKYPLQPLVNGVHRIFDWVGSSRLLLFHIITISLLKLTSISGSLSRRRFCCRFLGLLARNLPLYVVGLNSRVVPDVRIVHTSSILHQILLVDPPLLHLSMLLHRVLHGRIRRICLLFFRVQPYTRDRISVGNIQSTRERHTFNTNMSTTVVHRIYIPSNGRDLPPSSSSSSSTRSSGVSSMGAPSSSFTSSSFTSSLLVSSTSVCVSSVTSASLVLSSPGTSFSAAGSASSWTSNSSPSAGPSSSKPSFRKSRHVSYSYLNIHRDLIRDLRLIDFYIFLSVIFSLSFIWIGVTVLAFSIISFVICLLFLSVEKLFISIFSGLHLRHRVGCRILRSYAIVILLVLFLFIFAFFYISLVLLSPIAKINISQLAFLVIYQDNEAKTRPTWLLVLFFSLLFFLFLAGHITINVHSIHRVLTFRLLFFSFMLL
eukprot:284816647_4